MCIPVAQPTSEWRRMVMMMITIIIVSRLSFPDSPAPHALPSNYLRFAGNWCTATCTVLVLVLVLYRVDVHTLDHRWLALEGGTCRPIWTAPCCDWPGQSSGGSPPQPRAQVETSGQPLFGWPANHPRLDRSNGSGAGPPISLHIRCTYSVPMST